MRGGGVQVQTCRSVYKSSHDSVISVVMEMNLKCLAGRSKERRSEGGSTGEELEPRRYPRALLAGPPAGPSDHCPLPAGPPG